MPKKVKFALAGLLCLLCAACQTAVESPDASPGGAASITDSGAIETQRSTKLRRLKRIHTTLLNEYKASIHAAVNKKFSPPVSARGECEVQTLVEYPGKILAITSIRCSENTRYLVKAIKKTLGPEGRVKNFPPPPVEMLCDEQINFLFSIPQ